jgi:hypothetical protein
MRLYSLNPSTPERGEIPWGHLGYTSQLAASGMRDTRFRYLGGRTEAHPGQDPQRPRQPSLPLTPVEIDLLWKTAPPLTRSRPSSRFTNTAICCGRHPYCLTSLTSAVAGSIAHFMPGVVRGTRSRRARANSVKLVGRRPACWTKI